MGRGSVKVVGSPFVQTPHASAGLSNEPNPRGCYTAVVIERLRSILEKDERVAYALVFGSRARGKVHGHSDTDVAVGLVEGTSLSTSDVGDLISRLESAAEGPVDLVLLDEANPGLAYRIFRDGQVIVEKDRPTLVARRARAILEYLDFKPIEETFTRAVLEAGHRG
jgi:predicted nucleotidyltransferase